MRRHSRFLFAALLALFLVFSAFGPTPAVNADSSTACEVLTGRYWACVNKHGACSKPCQAIRNVVEMLGCGSGSSSGGGIGGGCSSSSY